MVKAHLRGFQILAHDLNLLKTQVQGHLTTVKHSRLVQFVSLSFKKPYSLLGILQISLPLDNSNMCSWERYYPSMGSLNSDIDQ